MLEVSRNSASRVWGTDSLSLIGKHRARLLACTTVGGASGIVKSLHLGENLTSPIFSLNETRLAPGRLPKAPGQTCSIQSPFPDLYPSLYLVSAIGLSLVLFVLGSPVQTSSPLPLLELLLSYLDDGPTVPLFL